jgi:hypothetical protein
MSILKTTRSGAQYAKWLEDLHIFSVRTLFIGLTMYRMNKKQSMEKVVEFKTIYDKNEDGSWKIGTRKFKFLATWTEDEFKQAFLNRLEIEKPQDCFLEEIPIPLEIKVEHEHT